MVAVAQVEPHSISHGTMREEDLIPAFLSELRLLDPERAEELATDHERVLNDDAIMEAEWGKGNERHRFLGELFDVLQEYAPEDLYFGAHPGNGSDYGFWAVERDA